MTRLDPLLENRSRVAAAPMPNSTATPLVFISYRRQDGTADANALRMRLEAALGPGTVFLDTVSIDIGRVWPDAIRAALDAVDVVLVVIGPTTLLKTDEYGRRLI